MSSDQQIIDKLIEIPPPPNIFNFMNNDINPDIRHVIFRKCTPAWRMYEHKLGACNLTYITQGEARYTINNKNIELKRGSLLTLPRDCNRKGFTFPDRLMNCFSVEFYLKNTENQEINLPFPLLSQPGYREDIIYLFHELAISWLDKQPLYMIKCKGLFLQIIHRFLELSINNSDPYTGDSRITKAIRHIEIHYSEHISVKVM